MREPNPSPISVLPAEADLAALEKRAAPPDGPEHPAWSPPDLRREVRQLVAEVRRLRDQVAALEGGQDVATQALAQATRERELWRDGYHKLADEGIELLRELAATKDARDGARAAALKEAVKLAETMAGEEHRSYSHHHQQSYSSPYLSGRLKQAQKMLERMCALAAAVSS